MYEGRYRNPGYGRYGLSGGTGILAVSTILAFTGVK
ncbi:hypothetical protein FRACA_2970007 [Frankia canadensis]|uniref:Uncharacterized protein n=1 Tax=Frankia canadensis TaxID=1836972 RepID=A0A2I2KTI8_9ACTN|nr:hypothetical protein FRACA_2970007 [Frankia canadensis]SOU56271.1 hypothetical protein FRACA_2970007 [Frankia canadensis]